MKPTTGRDPVAQLDVICCSLEPWDDVWRRNQFLATELLAQQPGLRLLFVQLPVDIVWSLLRRRRVSRTGVRTGARSAGETGRLWVMQPNKWLPRRVWPHVDR
jgi:teichuronic acid biosynthesis glycosyltransferase TuaH